MKIERVDTFVLRVPLGRRRFYSSQSEFPERTSALVRVTSTDGVVGWGEGGQYGPAAPVKACIDEVLAPQVLAMPEAMPAVVAETLYARTRDFGQKGTYIEAISAIDIALWDLLGRTLGAPVSTLLGGRFRERVKAYGTSGYYTDPEFRAARDLPGLADAVAGHVADGFDMLKMKIGLLPIAEDAARIRTVRETVGDDVVLLADANHAYNAATAIRVGRVLDEHGFACFEEPVIPEDRAGYSRVRSAVDVPISGGEAEFTRFGFRDFIEQARVDIVQPDLCVCGGFTETQRIATLASSHAVRTVPHVWGSAVALAAALQMCSVLPLTPYTLRPIPLQNEPVIEFDRTPNPLRDELLVEPFRLREGHLDVPTGPGLGIEIDLDQLEHFRTA